MNPHHPDGSGPDPVVASNVSASESLTIEIRRSPQAVYRYVTQPWRWHEWHPNSRSASSPSSELNAGDRFDEVIEIQPLSPLPLTLRRETRYTVRHAEPGRGWVVEGATRDGWLRIEYELEPTETGTRFTRRLQYGVSGLTAMLMPFLRSRMQRQSRTALDNLKERLESGAAD